MENKRKNDKLKKRGSKPEKEKKRKLRETEKNGNSVQYERAN